MGGHCLCECFLIWGLEFLGVICMGGLPASMLFHASPLQREHHITHIPRAACRGSVYWVINLCVSEPAERFPCRCHHFFPVHTWCERRVAILSPGLMLPGTLVGRWARILCIYPYSHKFSRKPIHRLHTPVSTAPSVWTTLVL